VFFRVAQQPDGFLDVPGVFLVNAWLAMWLPGEV